MGRRSKQHPRCDRCRMHRERCICDLIGPRLALATKVVMVLHRREVAKPTNTGRIALLGLQESALVVRGHHDVGAELDAHLDPGRRAWVLFPGDDAQPITPALVAEDPRPITLFVPDGTWGQARRAVRRERALRAARPVVLAPGPPTRYRLRAEHVEGGLATIEAVARALGVIEGPLAQAHLERIFEAMVAGTLASRAPGSD